MLADEILVCPSYSQTNVFVCALVCSIRCRHSRGCNFHNEWLARSWSNDLSSSRYYHVLLRSLPAHMNVVWGLNPAERQANVACHTCGMNAVQKTVCCHLRLETAILRPLYLEGLVRIVTNKQRFQRRFQEGGLWSDVERTV